MNRIRLSIALALTALAADAEALGRLADVQIVDRTTGAALATHYYRGEYWVAGTPGGRYAISISSRSGARLLAVTAVDGVNVVSGETAGWQQTGYVFSPYQSYEIAGWRKSNREVAAFEFTAAPNSYAERTGRPANVGVIGIALFCERVPEPVARALAAPAAAPPAAASAGAASDAAAAGAAQESRYAERLGSPAQSLGMIGAAPEPKLGTGHGAREASYVEDTRFDRLSERPNEVIRIRYDSYPNLVAMGVIRARPAPPPAPNPFPDSPQRYVPDPPGYSPSGLR